MYVVKADWLANALIGVNMEDYESLQYFQRVLIQSGIIKKLEEMGWNVITVWECELKKDKREQTLKNLYAQITG